MKKNNEIQQASKLSFLTHVVTCPTFQSNINGKATGQMITLGLVQITEARHQSGRRLSRTSNVIKKLRLETIFSFPYVHLKKGLMVTLALVILVPHGNIDFNFAM